MGVTTQFKLSATEVSILGATEAEITHLSMPTANTEYSHTLQDNLKSITIRTEKGSNLKFSFVMGESGTDGFPLPGCTTWTQDGLLFSGKTLYIQGDIAAETVYIMEFY